MRTPGDKSFQSGGAGKGDSDRTSDSAAYRENYDAINWGKPNKNWTNAPKIVKGDFGEITYQYPK